MPRLNLSTVIAPLLVVITLALAFHKMTAEPPDGPPPPTTAAAREAAGSGSPSTSEAAAVNTRTGGPGD